MYKIAVFDVETTGKDVGRDQIIEFSATLGLGEVRENKVWRIKPTIPVSPGAQEVHGISMEDLEHEPTFSQIGKEIRDILEDANVWVGYNLDFDINIVQAELKRNGFDEFDLQKKTIIDPYKLWKRMEKRSLCDAYRRFVGKELEGAHSAEVDTEATADVLVAMVGHYGLMETPLETISLMCEPERSAWIGSSRHLRWDDDGVPIVNFGGKNSGKPVMEVALDNPGYLNWIKTQDFPAHVRDVAEQALIMANKAEDDGEDSVKSEFVSWLKEKYGEPSALNGQ